MPELDRNRRRIPIRTLDYSERLRSALIDTVSRSIRLTDFSASDQGDDLSTLPNFGGYGRLHHFRREVSPGWPKNPLPLDPACASLGLWATEALTAQVFQSAGCNWRCWYCYVPFEDLTARRGALISVADMAKWVVDLDRPLLVDLTGGQPDLTPEWSLWMLEALDQFDLDDVYVWSDDNLSTDYLWRYLSPQQIDYLGSHPRYGRACCLKGFDVASFQFNTKAAASDFDNQIELLERLHHDSTIDYYLYVTFTTPTLDMLEQAMTRFVDRLQAVSETLPLRTVPLKIIPWGPVRPRLDDARVLALNNQQHVVDRWTTELASRFTDQERMTSIVDVPR